MVEFAILIPLLLLLVVGAIEFGLVFQRKITITAAAREGARAAVVQVFPYDDDAVRSAVRSVAPFLQDTNIIIDREVTVVDAADSTSVTIQYSHHYITSVMAGSVSLNSTVTMRNEQ